MKRWTLSTWLLHTPSPLSEPAGVAHHRAPSSGVVRLFSLLTPPLPPRFGHAPEPGVTPLMASQDALSRDDVALCGVVAAAVGSTNTVAPDVPVATNGYGGSQMPLLPAWTDDVSDHVMDAQVIAKRAVLEDGVVTRNEQALLDSLYAAQQRITVVHDEIIGVLTTIRTGRCPRRLRATNDEPLNAA